MVSLGILSRNASVSPLSIAECVFNILFPGNAGYYYWTFCANGLAHAGLFFLLPLPCLSLSVVFFFFLSLFAGLARSLI